MHLEIRPNVTMPWREFVRTAPSHSIALDGFVPEGPRFNPTGPWANFNHHEEVSRLETRATCAQVLIALRQGLMHSFDPEQTRVYVNDCDEDVCLSVYLLRHHGTVSARSNPRLNRLVFMEDMLDTTGGAYAFPETLQSLCELLWIFRPYHEFRLDHGGLGERDEVYARGVINRVGGRILLYLQGEAGTIEPDTRYDLLEQHGILAVVSEIGANARLGVYRDHPCFLAARRMPNGRFGYSLGRSSQFVPFPIPKIVKALNAAEVNEWRGMTEEMPAGSWGGSDVIAGSPREGSLLTLTEVLDVIKRVWR